MQTAQSPQAEYAHRRSERRCSRGGRPPTNSDSQEMNKKWCKYSAGTPKSLTNGRFDRVRGCWCKSGSKRREMTHLTFLNWSNE